MLPRFAWVYALVVGVALAGAAMGAVTPTPHVNPLAGQQKAVMDARQNLERARAELLVIRKRVAASFETKAEYKAAKEASDSAKSSYDSSNRKILAKLEKTPAYQELMAQRDKSQAVLDAANKKDLPGADDSVKLTDSDIADATKSHTEAVLAMKKMEKDAEDNDADLVAKRQRYQEARQAWESLQAQVDEAMKSDPAYMPAQQAVDQADAQYKSARESLAQASKAARPVHTPMPLPSRR